MGKKCVVAELKNKETVSGSIQGASCPCNQALEEEVHLQCKGGGSLNASSTLATNLNENTSRLSKAGVMGRSTSASPRSVENSSLHSSIHGYIDCHCENHLLVARLIY